MKRTHDAIVVGAGLGGLAAATYLAKRGLSVLLLEKHNVPGGYATSFVRGRFEFEVALHELSGLGRGDQLGPLGRFLDYLGVYEKVEFVQIPDFYRSIFDDLDITLPVDRAGFVKKLIENFPHERRGIESLFAEVEAVGREMKYFIKLGMGKISPSLIAKLPFNSSHMLRYSMATWGQVLERHVKDLQAQCVISQLWGYGGLPPSRISFLLYAAILNSYFDHGAAHVKGRSQDLSNAFVERFTELGGELKFNCAVQKILLEDGAVRGVVTQDGEEFFAPNVVSNASPITTCRDMIDPELVPAKFWRRMQAGAVAAGSVNVYLGLAAPAEELGLHDHECFLNINYDYDEHYRRMSTIGAPGQIAMTAYNSVLPDVSPPGTTMAVLTSLYYGEPWHDIAPRDYVDVKNGIGAAMLDMAEKVFPGLRRNCEVIEVSTPVTNMRYAGTLGGSIYGFDQTPSNAHILRQPHWGPLPGLFFVGAWTPPGGGFEPAMTSGRFAGEMVLMRQRRYGKGA
ncbi:MAG: NAD(P)/FAD-dependent oxidoreductase [Candidatus Lernaella stagnicola]|nr:NAD(P)/FAD-dependent oxidoreductase [Candidatus Lernaella stagnicola]